MYKKLSSENCCCEKQIKTLLFVTKAFFRKFGRVPKIGNQNTTALSAMGPHQFTLYIYMYTVHPSRIA
jgi:hypothetical protein